MKKKEFAAIRRRCGQLGGRTIQQAYDLHCKRQNDRREREKSQSLSIMTDYALWVKIPLGYDHWGMPVPEKYKLKRAWLNDRASLYSTCVHRLSLGRYSRSCTYMKVRHVQYVASRGCVVRGCLYYQIDTPKGMRKGILRPGKGWRFAVDAQGPLIIGPKKEDYHFSASEIVGNPITAFAANLSPAKRIAWLKDQARNNLRTRRAEEAWERKQKKTRQQREQELKAADKDGVLVCMKDSLKAGNCPTGTLSWIRHANFKPNKHYKPSVILRAGTNNVRVTNVVLYAIKRHKREIEQGYSELQDHLLGV